MNKNELEKKLVDFSGKLPIGKKLKDLNFSNTGILIGETACGKSLVTPVHAFLNGGYRRIIVRQPTRLASYLLMNSMYDIYGDSISVGCINRDQKINPDAPVLQVTDGILVEWLRDKQIWHDELIILDEIHATSEQLEISMGLIKRQGLRPWCLSATIDPHDIINYFNADVYYVSGINYPINKKQVFRDLRDFLLGDRKNKGYIDEKIIEKGHSCLVFLPTRFETESWASEISQLYENDIICKYIHGGVDVKEMAPFSHKENLDKPFILFSTPVSEQSITLDLNDVIVVNQKIEVNEYMGVKMQQRTYLPPNSLIQMMGRCGRYREGNVYVICDNYSPDIDFNNLRPTSVSYRLSNNTPFELAIILAGTYIKLSDVELITEVDREEYDFAVKILKKRKIIDNMGRLTEEGQTVMNIPLDYNLAQFVATAPDNILDIVIFVSGFGSHSLYHMEKFFPEGIPWDIIRKRRRLAVFESDLLTKYNIIREFYGLSDEDMKKRAEEMGLNLHVIINALNASKAVYDNLRIDPPAELPLLSKKLTKEFQEHVFNIMLFPPVKVKRNHYNNSYSCYIDDMKASTDSAATIRGGEKEIIFSSKTHVKNRYGEWFIRLSDNTICPKKLRPWCWPEETVKHFLNNHLSISQDRGYFYKISEKKYPATARLLEDVVTLAGELGDLYNKSPESFSNKRIGFIEILEDILVDICVNEKIKKISVLEDFLSKEKVYLPVVEDFIETENLRNIYDSYSEEIVIRDKSYPLFYKEGEAWVELPWKMVMEIKEDEISVNNFIVLAEDDKGIIKKLYSRGIDKARKDVNYFFTQKDWKRVKRAVKKKIKLNMIPNFFSDILSEKFIARFLGEPFYGWTALRVYGKKAEFFLCRSYEEAKRETLKSVKEYIRYLIKIEKNKIIAKVSGKERKNKRKKLRKKMLSLEDWAVKNIMALDAIDKKSLDGFLDDVRNRTREIEVIITSKT